ncbi:cobyric acid synthase [Ferrimicrobium acidiphilum]|uniref:cobyric acid synthase n=1 Tax=Ferrimicrobium acidiphilum TaxID=121039 RepID=UPI0023EF6F15|nr:cobyric acid synthase [Ferrimicrobium acidiphilum]
MTSLPGKGVLIAGTGSNVGKSLIVTGLLRWCHQRGIMVAPFKGQNMALNSAVAVDGGEVARAQAVQARAAGVDLSVLMNPVLIKPTAPSRSQLIVGGQSIGEIGSGNWVATKRELLTRVVSAYEELSLSHELVIAEGAGSAAEINLFDGDLANLRFAKAAGIGAVVVGDLEPGGVFASIYGHFTLIPDQYRAILRGFIINRVRGDGAILEAGIETLVGRLQTQWFGNLPIIEGYLPGEDAINLGVTRLAASTTESTSASHVSQGHLRVCVVEVPYLANYTDFDPLILEAEVDLRFVRRPDDLIDADLVILPGTKATVYALEWLRANGFVPALERLLDRGGWLLGVCGGYQMLATDIEDSVESSVGHVDGIGMLRAQVVFCEEKVLANVVGSAPSFGNASITGYQIHHGRVNAREDPLFRLTAKPGTAEVCGQLHLMEEGACRDGQVYGTSIHGIFDDDSFRTSFLSSLARARDRVFVSHLCFEIFVEKSIDHLAEVLDTSLDVERLLALDQLGR